MEGPSIHIVADELHKFVSSSIKKASGNAKFEKEPLVGQRIKEIFAFGKRLIIQLDTHAIVTHFLMYGTYRINEQRTGMAPRLALTTPKGAFYFYNCSTKCVKEKNLKKSLPMEWDILSPQWNVNKVVKAMQLQPRETIDDVLLDQDIFPGVGNIIKNEALFLSKISPLKKVNQLSVKKLTTIAQNARAFSQLFLNARKQFELKKKLQIYRKLYCPVCNSKIIRKKTGKRNRISFICPVCQQ